MVFVDNKERFGYETNMGIWKDSSSEDPKLRPWLVSGMNDRSSAYGDNILVCDSGRLVE